VICERLKACPRCRGAGEIRRGALVDGKTELIARPCPECRGIGHVGAGEAPVEIRRPKELRPR